MSAQHIGDHALVRLAVAAKLAFPDGSIGLSALRREIRKGRLKAWKIAGKLLTTAACVREMVHARSMVGTHPAHETIQ